MISNNTNEQQLAIKYKQLLEKQTYVTKDNINDYYNYVYETVSKDHTIADKLIANRVMLKMYKNKIEYDIDEVEKLETDCDCNNCTDCGYSDEDVEELLQATGYYKFEANK